MSFHKSENAYSVDESDIQSWVLNHLPLNSEQKWNLVQALKVEKDLIEKERLASGHPIELECSTEQDREQSSEPTDCKLPVTDESNPCLPSLETLCLQEAK